MPPINKEMLGILLHRAHFSIGKRIKITMFSSELVNGILWDDLMEPLCQMELNKNEKENIIKAMHRFVDLMMTSECEFSGLFNER